MNLDDLQRAWENQPAPERMLQFDDSKRIVLRMEVARSAPEKLSYTDDPDELAKRLMKKSHAFSRDIAFRNYLEATVAFLLAAALVWVTVWESPLRAGILATILISIGMFFVIDQRRMRKRRAVPSDSVLTNIRSALREVEHQIWLLKNAIWWYWIPCIVCMVVMMHPMLPQMPMPMFLFIGGVLLFLFALTHWSVRKNLVPRRNELAELLHSLETPEDTK